MGLFSNLRRAAAETRGHTLWQLLQDTIVRMGSLSEQVRAAAIKGFMGKRGKLREKLENMSADGRVKMGQFLQNEARKHFDTNMSEGYALWLAGAWLESMERPGHQAAMTHEYLEAMAREFEPILNDSRHSAS